MKDFAQSTYLSTYAPNGQWVHIMPAGQWRGYDGRGPYRLSNPAAVIAKSLRPKTDLVIDRDHVRFFNPTVEVKAAGWMKKMEVRDGEIWAYVEWVETAKQELEKKEYRYFSPEYEVDPETREIIRITGGTLTNTPNFELDAVASAQNPQTEPTIHKETKMDEHLKKLAKKLGLPETASTEDIEKACAARFDAAAALEAQVASVTKVLSVEKIDDVEKAIKEIREAASAETGKPDPEKYVPMNVHEEMASQLKELQDGYTGDKAMAAVEAAMAAGKITPAQKEWATEYATQNLAAFNKFIDGAPAVVSKNAQVASGKPSGDGALTESEAEVASQLGMSESDFLGKAANAKDKKEDKEAA